MVFSFRRCYRNIRQLILVFFSLNMLFWVWLGFDIVNNLQSHENRPPIYEEIVPVYKFGDQAIPSKADHAMISLETMRTIQQPVYFFVTKMANTNAISGGSWDERRGALSIGAWVLIATMLLSFLQWGIIAFGLGSIIQMLKRR
jgi:hypothetical protein